MGANLYAERVRDVGVQNNGDLNLSALQNLGINVVSMKPIRIDSVNKTINGSSITRTGDRTARTAAGEQIRVERLGDKMKVHVNARTLTFHANGAIAIAEPDTYSDKGLQSLTFEDPKSGMPVNASGAVRLREFEVVQTAKETAVQSDEYDIRKANFEKVSQSLSNSGLRSSTFGVGGIELAIHANGVVVFDPTFPEKVLTADRGVLSELKSTNMPVLVPKFTVENGRMLFPNGTLRLKALK